MDIKDIQKKAEGVFKANPKTDVLIGTQDGNFFLPAAKSLAKDHARRIGSKTFEITRDGECTHPQAVADQLDGETAKKAREDKPTQDQIKADQERKAAEVEAARIEEEKKAEAKAAAEEATKKAIAQFGVDVAESTIKELTEWSAKQTNVELLTAALDVADTQGGKAAIEKRIKELNTAE